MTQSAEKELKPTSNPLNNGQQDLVDLPEEVPQPTWKQYVMTPKFILLVVLTVGIVGRNVYLEYNKPSVPVNEVKKTSENAQSTPMSQELFSRFFWYIVLTIVFFVAFVLLKRSNDAAQQERVREEVRKQQEEAQRQKKIDEKAKKILTSMDQFGNVIDESAFNKNQPQTQTQQKLTQESKKEK